MENIIRFFLLLMAGQSDLALNTIICYIKAFGYSYRFYDENR